MENKKSTNKPYICTPLAKKSAILEGITHGRTSSAIVKDFVKIDSENLLDLKVIQDPSITKIKDRDHQIQITRQMTFKQSEHPCNKVLISAA